MINTKNTYTASLALSALMLASGCSEPNPNDFPVSHWLKDPDVCVRKAAQGILASGRPYPNEKLERTDYGHRLVRYDMWLADHLYEMPGEWGSARGSVDFH